MASCSSCPLLASVVRSVSESIPFKQNDRSTNPLSPKNGVFMNLYWSLSLIPITFFSFQPCYAGERETNEIELIIKTQKQIGEQASYQNIEIDKVLIKSSEKLGNAQIKRINSELQRLNISFHNFGFGSRETDSCFYLYFYKSTPPVIKNFFPI